MWRLSYLGNPDSESSLWIYMMVSGKRDACTATISLAFSALPIAIQPRFNYFILRFHVLESPYILIFIEFTMEWIYMSILRHTQVIFGNLVIKGDSVSNYPPILEHRFETLRPYYHGLDGPDIESEKGKNRQSRRCFRRDFIPFVFFLNKQVVSF